jgi:general L-amino acid transport system substrate-binding protein
MKKLMAAAIAGLGLAITATAASAQAPQTLAQVKSRGILVCGSNTGLAGFGVPDAQGNWQGLDVDYCRAISSAIFNDPNKVKFIPLSAKDRFTALQSGEVDLLSRSTTWTLQRDTVTGLNFAVVSYYDGAGFLVPRKLGVTSAKQLNGATICVSTGTTTELVLADYFRQHGMSYKTVTFENAEETRGAFFAGRCDAYTTDLSQLASARAMRTGNPDDYMLLPELMSKEPLGLAVRHGDDQWFDIVKWVFYALVEAEEQGVTSANVDEKLKDPTPTVQRLLGVTAGNGKALGLDEKWAYYAIKQVGNYSEIFERNLGEQTPMKLKRGINDLWTRGGLMYAIPLR